ncbi:MAG TPA: cob(I)yrinic acid a,c-diamide adenosyltransferase [Bryobacteraceae bacterium]|nr:cob(I)yrinic acid a,c-diamide adenosyltransferase [Bryobacteraceae bacterium]
MEDPAFNEPRLALNRIYTKGGDAGETSLAGGQRLPKDARRIEAYGTVDELNAWVGAACLTCEQLSVERSGLTRLTAILRRVQHELFNLGSILATLPGDVHPRQAQVTEVEIRTLESEIDEMNAGLPGLRSFVLPGGCRANVELHVCRTVCRRAERVCVSLAREGEAPPEAVRYLNRLSDAFFVWSRWVSQQLGVPETLWEPNRAASGSRQE